MQGNIHHYPHLWSDHSSLQSVTWHSAFIFRELGQRREASCSLGASTVSASTHVLLTSIPSCGYWPIRRYLHSRNVSLLIFSSVPHRRGKRAHGEERMKESATTKKIHYCTVKISNTLPSFPRPTSGKGDRGRTASSSFAMRGVRVMLL